MNQLQKILDQLKEEYKNNEIPITIFKMEGSFEDNYDFIDHLMDDDFGNGIYRLTAGCKVSSDYMEKARLVLFQNNIGEEKLIFGWGILGNGYSPIIKNGGTKGPYEMTDDVRKRMREVYEYNKTQNKWIETESYQSDSLDFDKKYFHFETAKLLKSPLTITTIIENNTKYYSFDNSEIKTIKSEFVSNTQGLIEKDYIYDIDEFINNILKETIPSSKLKLPIHKYPHSLIEQIDSYNIENIHTVFLKNFIDENNIYRLGNEPMNHFIKLIAKKSNKKELEQDTYIPISQKRLIDQTSKAIQPDLVLEGNKYRIIIEVKYYSTENENQTKKYYDYYQSLDKKENIYVYLSLIPTTGYLSIEEEKKQYIFTRVLFKELVEEVYNTKKYSNIYNREILESYQHAFKLVAASDRRVSIENVPYIPNSFTEKECNSFYEKLVLYKIPQEAKIEFKSSRECNLARYILVVLYNEKNNYNKEQIKAMYNSCNYYQ